MSEVDTEFMEQITTAAIPLRIVFKAPIKVLRDHKPMNKAEASETVALSPKGVLPLFPYFSPTALFSFPKSAAGLNIVRWDGIQSIAEHSFGPLNIEFLSVKGFACSALTRRCYPIATLRAL